MTTERLKADKFAELETRHPKMKMYATLATSDLYALIATARREAKQAEELARVTLSAKHAESVRVDLKKMRARIRGIPIEQEYDTHGLDYTTCIGAHIDRLTASLAAVIAERDAMRATLQDIAGSRDTWAPNIQAIARQALAALNSPPAPAVDRRDEIIRTLLAEVDAWRSRMVDSLQVRAATDELGDLSEWRK